MIDVVWLKPRPLDHFMLMDIFANVNWNPVGNLDYNIIDTFEEATQDGVVAIIPGASQDAEEINEKLKLYKWVLLIIVSDEENLFELDKIGHPNLILWVQTPRANVQYKNARVFGVGYAFSRQFVHKYKKQYSEKSEDVFISGQNTHKRRRTIFKKLHTYAEENQDKNVQIFETEGFTQGMKSPEYYKHIANAKVVPCPSGVVSPDSFRLYEALEFGAIPIADDISPDIDYDSTGYWNKVLPNAPFPTLKNNKIASLIDKALNNFPQYSNDVFSWWIKQKRQFSYDLIDDIRSIADKPAHVTTLKDKMTVIIPVSPWKSHPDTSILETTIASARSHFPDSEIIITFDGVRKEQEDRFDDYQEFVKRMLWKINVEYDNILPLVFKKHAHQVKMMREALKYVRTQSVIYIEGDSPLYEDRPIDWNTITDLIAQDNANIIRLYNKEAIPVEHEYLMYPEENWLSVHNDDVYVATSQWSQQPHIVRADTYREIIDKYFTEKSICFIEDKFYYNIVGESKAGLWNRWKMFIYIPEDKKPRSYHLDGRSGGDKYDDKQVW